MDERLHVLLCLNSKISSSNLSRWPHANLFVFSSGHWTLIIWTLATCVIGSFVLSKGGCSVLTVTSTSRGVGNHVLERVRHFFQYNHCDPTVLCVFLSCQTNQTCKKNSGWYLCFCLPYITCRKLNATSPNQFCIKNNFALNSGKGKTLP